ncbi:VOC family protein [Nonomuraea sp. H19]|uniref:VOC family protein n=1 Tax=Nonomuraea sp. H19 TaxID=3452206 RepID=UPI003F89808A
MTPPTGACDHVAVRLSGDPSATPPIDHVLVAVPDLQRATTCLRDLGFVVADGGCHPTLGTRNALVQWADAYVELITPHDPAVAAANPLGADLLRFLEQRAGGLLGFCLRLTEAHVTRRLADLTAGWTVWQDVTRTSPSGTTLMWDLAFPGTPRLRGPSPFFIRWHPQSVPHRPVRHPNSTRGIEALHVHLPERSAVYEWYRDVLISVLDGHATAKPCKSTQCRGHHGTHDNPAGLTALTLIGDTEDRWALPPEIFGDLELAVHFQPQPEEDQ